MEEKNYGFGLAGDGTLVIGEVQNNLSIHSFHHSIYGFYNLNNINMLQKGQNLTVRFKVQRDSEKSGTLKIVYGKPRIVDENGVYYKIEQTCSIKIKGYND